MRFAELFEKYKNGSASPEERALVEEEIEKSELINDYLSEQLPELELSPPRGDSASQELRQIRRAVNRQLWRVAGLTGALLLGAMALGYFVGLPLYDRSFYNPMEAVEGVPDLREAASEERQYLEDFSPLYLSGRAFTELHSPGWTQIEARAKSLGLGQHDAYFYMVNGVRGERRFNCRIDRGQQVQDGLNSQWFFPTPQAGVFYDRGPQNVFYVQEDGSETTAQQADSRQLYRERLESLPESCKAGAYITFPEDWTLEQAFQWEEQWEGACLVWLGVRTCDESYFEPLGFTVSGGGFVLESTEEFDRLYPSFDYTGDWKRLPKQEQIAYLEEHFCSLLRYMSQQQDFLDAFCRVNSYNDTRTYTEALDYVQEKGLKVYGAYVEGNPKALLALEESPLCHSFQLDEIKLY